MTVERRPKTAAERSSPRAPAVLHIVKILPHTGCQRERGLFGGCGRFSFIGLIAATAIWADGRTVMTTALPLRCSKSAVRERQPNEKARHDPDAAAGAGGRRLYQTSRLSLKAIR